MAISSNRSVRLSALICISLCNAVWVPGPVGRQQEYLAAGTKMADASLYEIPSVHESAVMARRILHLSTIGTLVTTFPEASDSSETAHSLERRPASLAGNPIGLMEYYADCEPETGNPTFLALSIATPQRNYAAGSNISLSLRWWPEQTTSYASTEDDGDDVCCSGDGDGDEDDVCDSGDGDDDDDDYPTPHTPAALPRFSLHGHLQHIDATDMVARDVPACFVRAHPDAAKWQPGNPVHGAAYVRLVVEHIYWIGGFGDRARIGWLPVDEWRNVTMEEVAMYRLPGEGRRGGRGRCRGRCRRACGRGRRAWYEYLKFW